ncbi:MAG: glycine--tRNA ligase subunit beta [Pseudomonadota bacterium]
MPELLIELLSEEIPARMQARAAQDLKRHVNDALINAGFLPEGVEAFAGPRRLTVVVTGLPTTQPDLKEEKKGPRVGAPEKATDGFLKSAGLSSLNACEVRSDKKGEFYVAIIDRKGRPTADLIAELFPEIVKNFPWPKSMRWGEGDLKWVRPLTSILCVFDNEVVPFTVDTLSSGDVTRGHRFMSNDVLQARNFEAYETALRNAKVMLDGDARKELIAREATTLCEAQGLELVDDPGLLAEAAGLAEWPMVLIGTYDEKFLSLPDEVLTASMRGHQKYFSVRDPETGHLTNRFICVANLDAPDGGTAMRAGYERVLTARLSDAWYLYNQDLKQPLEGHVDELYKITFFEGLGSIGDKVDRVTTKAMALADAVGAKPDEIARAARLSKADLVTGMVNEFPELQGVMGRYYAKEQGDPDDIADAVKVHYQPIGQDEVVPTAPISIAVALADKIDTLTSFWSIGKKPTGSGDPFALRRAALGVIRIILENKVRMPLPCDPGDILLFFHDRLKVYLRDQGRKHDRIDAIRHRSDGMLRDDLVEIVARLDSLDSFLEHANGMDLIAAHKRAKNILKAEAKKTDSSDKDGVRENLLEDAVEQALFASLTKVENTVKEAIKGEDFATAMSALSSLREPIDAFFENVKVNADNPAVRLNRLALLQQFTHATALVADFEKLEG